MTPRNVADLVRRAVLETGADLGIAHDGDADRCLAVTAAGDVVDGDEIMAILALAMRDAELRDQLFSPKLRQLLIDLTVCDTHVITDFDPIASPTTRLADNRERQFVHEAQASGATVTASTT